MTKCVLILYAILKLYFVNHYCLEAVKINWGIQKSFSTDTNLPQSIKKCSLKLIKRVKHLTLETR